MRTASRWRRGDGSPRRGRGSAFLQQHAFGHRVIADEQWLAAETRDAPFTIGFAAKIHAAGRDHRRTDRAELRRLAFTTVVDVGEMHDRSEEHTSELQSLMRISYAVFCLKKKR